MGFSHRAKSGVWTFCMGASRPVGYGVIGSANPRGIFLIYQFTRSSLDSKTRGL
jgi:hypothetical protein